MAINQDSKRFLETLGEGPYVFQTFSDAKKGGSAQATSVRVGTLEKHGDILSGLNSELKAGVFVQVNAGLKRGASNITGIRAVFVDLDNPETVVESLKQIKKTMPAPSFVVKTSQQKFHIYWLVDDCQLDEFGPVQTELAKKFNGDPSMKNLDRVMRIPGFYHNKAEPSLVQLMSCTGNVYSIVTINKHLKEATAISAPPPPTAMPTGGVGNAFGLDSVSTTEKYVIPTEKFAPATRTYELTRFIGWAIGEAYSEKWIEDEVRRMNVELCPEGDEPLTEDKLEMEILPAIYRFSERQEERLNELEGRKAERREENAAKREVEKEKTKNLPEPEVKKAPPPPSQPETMDGWLARYILVSEGSRIIDSHKLGRYGEYTMTDFKNKKANVLIPTNNGGEVALSTRWLKNRMRRTVRDTYYQPGGKQIVTVQNHQMWNLYAPSEVHPVKEYDEDKIRPFIEHIEYMFPKKKDFEIIMCWLAMTIQNPEIRIPWAPLIISGQGVGKGFVYQVLATLVGTHNSEMILPDRLESAFNPYMGSSVLICIDEMKTSRYSNADKLKSLISEPFVEINEKGKPERTQQVYANFIIFTNHDNSAFIEQDDRRFWVYKIPNKKRTAEYYTHIWNWFYKEPQGLNHLHRYFLDYDISNFQYAQCPEMTEAKLHMIDSNKSQLELDIEDAITHKEDIFRADVVGYKSVKDWAEAREGMIHGKTEGLFRQIWGRLGVELNQFSGGIRPLNDVKNVERQRVRCIRNEGHWSAKTPDEVKYEFTRSLQFGANVKKVLPPLEHIKEGKVIMKAVGDDEDDNRA